METIKLILDSPGRIHSRKKIRRASLCSEAPVTTVIRRSLMANNYLSKKVVNM